MLFLPESLDTETRRQVNKRNWEKNDNGFINKCAKTAQINAVCTNILFFSLKEWLWSFFWKNSRPVFEACIGGKYFASVSIWLIGKICQTLRRRQEQMSKPAQVLEKSVTCTYLDTTIVAAAPLWRFCGTMFAEQESREISKLVFKVFIYSGGNQLCMFNFTFIYRCHPHSPASPSPPRWIMASEYYCGAQQLFCSCVDVHTNEQHLGPSRADASTALQNRIQNLSLPMIPCHNITATSSSSSLTVLVEYIWKPASFFLFLSTARLLLSWLFTAYSFFLYEENLAFWNQTGPHLFA